MTPKVRDVRTYIDELQKTKEGRSEQVREGLEIYIGLWEKAIELGIVAESDPIEDALAKVEEKGGLYAAAGEEREGPP